MGPRRWLVTILLLFRTTNALKSPDSSLAFVPNKFNATKPDGYQILEDSEVYRRWRTLVRRKVQAPGGKLVDYDIIGQVGSGAAIIFAWNSSSKSATIIREYNPGPHETLYGLAAGLIEEKHGANPRVAAEHELEEECHLKGGEWYELSGRPLAMDKYVTTKVYPFLVIDPEYVQNPRPLDEEEDIEILPGVSADEILGMIDRAEMNIVGAWASLLAINKLRELGQV